MKIKWHSYFWRFLHIRPISLAIDDHSIDITSCWSPLLDIDIEVYFRKNHWVHRGIYFSLNVLGLEIAREDHYGAQVATQAMNACGHETIEIEKFCPECGALNVARYDL